MNKNAFTVISLGNYETKIFCCVTRKDMILPFYNATFLTNSFFQNSRIIDDELFKETLNNAIRAIPISINSTNVILNIPIKEIKINNFSSDEYFLNENLSEESLKIILDNLKEKLEVKNNVILDHKIFLWILDGKEYLFPPFGKKVERFSFKSKSYYLSKSVIDNFVSIFNNINIRIDQIKIDSLVLHHLFKNQERRFKLLFNVGHVESTFEFFDNMVLSSQKKIKFGIKDLTKKICEATGLVEIEAINLLKKYKDLVLINKELPLLNNFKEQFLDYSQFRIKDVSVIIMGWLKELIQEINNQIAFLFSLNYDVDELYFFSSTDIFSTWINYIQPKLIKFLDLKILNANLIGLNETKYASLIASIIDCKTLAS
ncbi:MAG: hypothetical protein RR803_00380 [Malacoplasma sp.]